MNRKSLSFISVAAVALVLTVRTATGAPKGEEVTVKGEVIDLWCYLEGGDHGADHKDCATMCAKAGNPIGILDQKGNIYVVMGLKEHQPGKDLLLAGSGQLFNALMKENLIDLYRFMLHPVVLGKGMRLFPEGGRRALELTETKQFKKGIVILEYVPAKEQ